MHQTIFSAALTAGLALASSASAADLNAYGGSKDVPAYVQSWVGFYVGASAGGLHNVVGTTENYGDGDDLYNWQYAGSSLFGSVNVGYNLQRASLVYGIEADYGFANAGGTDTATQQGFGLWEKGSEKLTALGTVRARLGYAMDKSLLYATGGFAYGNVKRTYWYWEMDSGIDESGWLTGWTAGAGFEQALTGNLAITGQFLYVDLGSSSSSADAGDYVFGFSNQEYVATLGLKYRFTGGLDASLK